MTLDSFIMHRRVHALCALYTYKARHTMTFTGPEAHSCAHDYMHAHRQQLAAHWLSG